MRVERQVGIPAEEVARLEIEEVHPLGMKVLELGTELEFEVAVRRAVVGVEAGRNDSEDNGSSRRIGPGRSEKKFTGPVVRLVPI